jgi:hypothetical protein
MSVLLVDTVAPPAPPVGLTATVSGQQVTLAWRDAQNLISNPSFEVDTAGWGNVGLTRMERLTGAGSYPFSGVANLFTENTVGGDNYAVWTLPAGAVLDSLKGKTMTLSAYVHKVGGWSNAGGPPAGSDRSLMLSAGAGGFVDAQQSAVPFDALTRVSVTMTVPTTATVLEARLYNGGIGHIHWDAVMLHEGSTPLAYDAISYSAYRDGVQIYAGTATGYVDAPLIGTWVYTVSATNDGGESARSTPVTASVTLGIVIAASASVPGLNATHIWYPAGGGPSVVINPAPAGVLPRTRLTGEIAGWGNPPPGDDRRTVPVGRVLAERQLRSGRHGKTLTYQGVVEARTDLELRNVTGALSRAFGDPNMGEGRMLVEPWDGRPSVEYYARVTGYDCPEATPSRSALGRASRGAERGFTLQVHLSRGRMFSTTQSLVSAVANQTDLALTVGGNAPTEPIFTLQNGIAATDDLMELQGFLRLGFLLLPDANGLQINFATRTIRNAAGTVERRGYLDRADASWWSNGNVGLNPGARTVKRKAGRGSWTIQWQDAWW